MFNHLRAKQDYDKVTLLFQLSFIVSLLLTLFFSLGCWLAQYHSLADNSVSGALRSDSEHRNASDRSGTAWFARIRRNESMESSPNTPTTRFSLSYNISHYYYLVGRDNRNPSAHFLFIIFNSNRTEYVNIYSNDSQ